VVGDNLVIKLDARRNTLWFAIPEFVTAIGLFLINPAYLILSRAIGASTATLARKTRDPRKIAHNLIVATLGESVAVIVARNTGIGSPLRWESWCSVATACLTIGVLTTVCVLIVVLADGGKVQPRALGRLALTSTLIPVTFACLALGAVILLTVGGWASLALISVVIAMFAFLLRRYLGLSSQMDELDTMYRFARQLQGVSNDKQYLGTLLAACRDTMAAQSAVIVMLDGTGQARITYLDDQDKPTPVPGPANMLAPLWLRAITSGKLVLAKAGDPAFSQELEAHGWQDAVVAPMRTTNTGEIFGAIAVHNCQVVSSGTFKQSQARLFSALAPNAAVSLENMQMVDQLRHNAAHDPLTGLPNRESFHAHVDRILEQNSAHQLAVLLIDLDRFKDVNDTLGHAAGDQILVGVALRLQQAIGHQGAYIARLGADDFAVMLPNTDDLSVVAQATEDIISAIEQPFTLGDTVVDVGATVGMATYPEHGGDSSALLKRADIAMGAAKGVSRYAMYSSERDRRTPRSLSMVSDLRQAIQQRQVDVHFQPYVDMRSEQIVGAEALVRWQHPRHGLIYPDEFIPLAERSGLIRPLTAMVLDKALAQQQEWRQIGHDLTMNVNLSVRDILEGDLAADIDAAMRHYHTDPEKLMLEITETCIATDREGAIKTMHALHNLGTQLAIDDFGTGYSSLSYLKDMPFNEIKVDKSFVMTMRANDISAAITQYIIELGKRLGLFVVAEGVENVEDWKDLIGYGCDVAQGYLISKPIAPDQLLELIRNQTASLFKPA